LQDRFFARQGELSQAGCRPTRKLDAVWRKICPQDVCALFADRLLILACGSANPAEQIVWMNKQQFIQHLHDEKERQTAEQKALLSLLEKEFHISAMENPFEYVKELQSGFDYGMIRYRDEYYEILGIEP